MPSQVEPRRVGWRRRACASVVAPAAAEQAAPIAPWRWRRAARAAVTGGTAHRPLLTLPQLETIRARAYADDVDIDLGTMRSWSAARARAYFEAGGIDDWEGDDDGAHDDEEEDDEVRPPSEPPEGSDVEDEPVGMAVGDGDSEEDAVAGPAAAHAMATHATVHDEETDRGRAPSSSDEGSDAEPPPPPSEEEEVAEEEDEEVDEEGTGGGGSGGGLLSAQLRRDSQGRFKIMLAEDADGLYLKNMGDVDVDDDRSALRVHDYLHLIGGMPASRLSLAEARELIKSAADPLELSVRLERGDPRAPSPKKSAARPRVQLQQQEQQQEQQQRQARAEQGPTAAASEAAATFGASFDVSFEDAFASLPPSAFGEGTPFEPATPTVDAVSSAAAAPSLPPLRWPTGRRRPPPRPPLRSCASCARRHRRHAPSSPPPARPTAPMCSG